MTTTHPHDDHLSALCDGELPEQETRFLLRRLDHDRPLAARYERYLAIGMCLRRETPVAPPGFADAVWLRLDADVTVTPTATTVTVRRLPAWVRAAAGGAIAAGVAAVALVALAPPAQPGAAPQPTLAETSVLRDRDMRGSVPLERVTERQSFTVPVGQAATPVDAQVESYFLRHSGASWSAARGGYVPYVHVVATPRAAQATASRETPAGR